MTSTLTTTLTTTLTPTVQGKKHKSLRKARLSFDEFDELRDPRPEASDFSVICERRYARRSFLGGAAAVGAAAFVRSVANSTGAVRSALASGHGWLDFKPIQTSTADTITLPQGFSWHRVISWGDPMWSSTPDFNHNTRGNGASQERAFGDNCDGMSFFSRGNTQLLVVNNEYANLEIITGNRPDGLPANDDDVRKVMASHGVSIVEVATNNGQWRAVIDSPYNRRITPATPMSLTGPARGHALLRTEADPSGTLALGTWNNCGNGQTPWGTYLTCEENFNGYFLSSDPDLAITPEWKRYGIGHEDWGYNFARIDERFDIAKHPNESHRAGWIVEINPFDPQSAPKKRTALGRFKHENAAFALSADGHAVVYLGDDERGEFLYRFVSSGRYNPSADNSELLAEGTLAVAIFDDNGKGKWMDLTPETTGMSDAENRIFARIAASKVGATTMDRPEWVTVNPRASEAYCALTNNKNRGVKPNAGGDPTPTNGPNPREKNNYGQIVRWRPAGGDHGAETFAWDLFVTAGNPSVHSDAYAGSANITQDNHFNSPDGISFDTQGGLWIQTDGNYSNEGDYASQGNNQMLFANPASGEIKRFLVGPKECEITGATWSSDLRTMFVGVQHPGEGNGESHWPDAGNSVPRSSVIAITRDDGGPMG